MCTKLDRGQINNKEELLYQTGVETLRLPFSG